MPATPDGAPCGSVAEQREWFWLNFSQELARAKAACATDAERERLDQLRNGVKWLHNAIWQIHSIRPNAQPDDLNLAATELLLQCHRFQWLIPVDDMDRLAAVHEQGFVAKLAGLELESFGLLCILLAEWHIEKLMAHRSDLSPRTPNPKTSHFANHIDVQEGHCFYSRQDPATGLRVADCSPDDVQAVNAEFDANRDFNFAGQVATGETGTADKTSPELTATETAPPAASQSNTKPVDESAKGVSLQDAALILSERESSAARLVVKRWRESRDPKLPKSIGVDLNHRQRQLFKLEQLLKFIGQTEGESAASQCRSALKSLLRAARRPSRPKTARTRRKI